MDIVRPAHDIQSNPDTRAINLRAPILTLPHEILSAVFEAGHVSSHSDRSQPPLELLVAQVTRRWRDVALSTPKIWTYIHIRFSAKGRSKAEVYLSRSGALPLDLFLEIEENKSSGHNTSITLVVDIISHHITRWQSLRIDMAEDGVGRPNRLLFVLPSMAPRLQCLQISAETFEESIDEGDFTSYIFNGGAPSLTSVRIRGLGFHLCQPPLATVTRLELHFADDVGISSAKFASLLAGLSALTFLVINGDYVAEWTPGINVTMPSLQRCHIHTNLLEQIPGLLKMISAPLLHSLLLDNVNPSDIDDFIPSLELTSGPPKYPHLRSLTISTEIGSSFKSSTWMNVVRAFPTVTHFLLQCHSSNEFMRVLHSVSWPELHTLTLAGHGRRTAPTLLCGTVSTRIALGHAIRRLCLSSALMSMLSADLEWLGTQLDVEELPQVYFFGVDWSDEPMYF